MEETVEKTIGTQLEELYGIEINITDPNEKETGHSIIFASSENCPIAIKLLKDSYDTSDLSRELAWQFFISENGVFTPRVYKSIGDNYYEKVVFNGGERVCIVMERIVGVELGELLLTDELIVKIGKETAKMHQLSDKFKQHENNDLKYSEWHEDECLAPRKYLKSNDKLFAAATEVIEEIHSLPKDKDSYGLIHSDLQPHNMILKEEDVYIIDFESILNHWFLIDFISTLEGYLSVGVSVEEQQKQIISFTQNYFRGYQSEREIDSFWVSKIPLFYRLWEIVLLNELTERWDMANLTQKRKDWLRENTEDIINKSRFDGIDLGSLI